MAESKTLHLLCRGRQQRAGTSRSRQVCALRFVPEFMSHLPGAWCGDGFASRANSANDTNRRRRTDQRFIYSAHGTVSRLQGLRDRLSFRRSLWPDDRSCPGRHRSSAKAQFSSEDGSWFIFNRLLPSRVMLQIAGAGFICISSPAFNDWFGRRVCCACRAFRTTRGAYAHSGSSVLLFANRKDVSC